MIDTSLVLDPDHQQGPGWRKSAKGLWNRLQAVACRNGDGKPRLCPMPLSHVRIGGAAKKPHKLLKGALSCGDLRGRRAVSTANPGGSRSSRKPPPRASSWAFILKRRAKRSQQHAAPTLWISGSHPELQSLDVIPHESGVYDEIHRQAP